MKKNHIIISNYIIIIYIILIIFNYNLTKSINKENSEIKEKQKNFHLLKLFKNLGYYQLDINKKSAFPPKPPFNETDDMNRIEDLENQIKKLDTEITKSKIYIIFLSILAIIFFLMIVIYSSIKCYIVCSKKSVQDYRISDLNINKLGEVYIDEDGGQRISSSKRKDINNYDAPIYANNNNSQQKTFNPDNCISSSQDKKLYKPYNNEDIQ